ncbi:MAG: hypothetical protein A3C43_07450 [Candidatus Schekmanbacteria bacterium RIFCSPHIGHO2_02_FULL_38_11]|uniref:Type II secretion system protein GspI n=1 Tax=Candidatus Schekmanbacteria bacterium RIFCSPLOWO2_12_FULL_38_15 TaxID=1817883 RepID=A0A1F7SJ04_9BACT|nr:MAG: hypothetical protein A2043_01665 [Candidatus Schekmanbacteria bacterium GWA2_38_9]OGL47903.1 MAG: hypothetical protein A3H37_11280 [Candidatus Schekmanbacteria bacterium RIFCSPLOWO2_02_FULL_38_14]OGL53749.1 MAG: hypothetical protein A3G31_03320 [Candidatus Schekmanbacteria bacterium RIFCSPLOWO2_12_FULL_38_15]OGL55509.1 MAG: hypothetical protein A3C43_07450 [Candidatus Schekmanbacteria bacterium RIFCSPHIGHO2_02_FULL_38_11]
MRDEKGFTFLEIMVAVAILSIALIAALRAQSQSLSIASESIRTTNVVFLAREKMAEIELDGYPQQEKTDGVFEKHPEYRWEIEVKETPVEDLKDVTLTILWKEGDRERRYSLETLLARKD